MRFLETKIPAPIVAAGVGATMKWYARAHGVVVDPSPWRMLLGVGLSQLSAAIALAAVACLWQAGTTVNPLNPTRTTALVTRGVFRFTRNPMYLSLLVLLVAYAVRLESLAVWLAPLFFAGYVTRFQITPEERALRLKFGDAFVAYETRTRRWL